MMFNRTFITSLRAARPIVFFYLIHFVLGIGLLVKANSYSFKVADNLNNKPSDSDSDNNQVFKATDEWQQVRKGQPIPKGLHVRINFETGITEAKKLGPEESKTTAVTVVQKEEEVDVEEHVEGGLLSNKDYLEDVMHNVHGDDVKEQVAPKKSVSTPPKIHKTYDELKRAMDEMNLLQTTDMEMLAKLISKYAKSSNNTKRVTILTDLEYLVHQFDNAVEFDRLNGFSVVVYPSFNDTDVAVRSAAVRLLGSAVQSNPQVQISALSSGSVQLLLRTLLHDKDVTTRSCALFALSCLVRHFPAAQVTMVKEGGLSVLAQAFDHKENAKLQIKVVTLLYDLLQENQPTETPETATRLDLESKLYESEWCNRIPGLLAAEMAKPDNDVVEKVSNAMLALVNVCYDDFNTTKVRTMLFQLEMWYSDMVQSDPDEYFEGLAHLLKNLLTRLKTVNVEL